MIENESATWMDRLIAIFIDLIVLWLVAQVLPFTFFYYKLLPEDAVSSFLEFLSNAEHYLLAPAYFFFLRYFWNGQTIGKRVLRIKTVPSTGEKLKLWQAFMDCLGYIIWPIDFILGVFLSKSGEQRLTQVFAGSKVVRVENSL